MKIFIKSILLNRYLKTHLLLRVCFFYMISSVIVYAGQSGSIIVDVKGLKSDEGYIDIALHNKADAFPLKPEMASETLRGRINGRETSMVFNDIPYGEYAVAVYHDEDGNGKMDTNFLGIPREGIGSSNGAKGHFGPPKFADAKFRLNENQKTVVIKMSY